MYRWHFKFQRCNASGQYFGNTGWFEISVIAPNYNDAIQKAMRATRCDYVHRIESRVEEIQEAEDGKIHD